MLDRPLETPPKISNAKVRRAAEEYRRLVADHQAAGSAAHGLEQGRREAVEVDRRAYAVALRGAKGKGVDPGQPATLAADRELLKIRRREEALEHAVTEARNELVAAVDQNRDEWSTSLEKRLADARAGMLEAIDSLASSHAELAEAHAVVAWVEQFPQQSLWRPGRFVASLPSVRTQAGEPVPTAAAIDALRLLAEPPAKPEHPA